jgi:hypothetical protein
MVRGVHSTKNTLEAVRRMMRLLQERRNVAGHEYSDVNSSVRVIGHKLGASTRPKYKILGI